MDYENNVISDNLFENVKNQIQILYQLNLDLKNIYMTCNIDDNQDMKKTVSGLQFKIRNYNKWISLLKSLSIEDFISKEKIKKIISSKSLCTKIKEINDTNKLNDISKIKLLINTLEEKISSDFTTKKINKRKWVYKYNL